MQLRRIFAEEIWTDASIHSTFLSVRMVVERWSLLQRESVEQRSVKSPAGSIATI